MKKPLSIVLIIIALAGIAFGIWGTVRANGLQDALDKKIAEVGPQFEALKAQGDEAVAADQAKLDEAEAAKKAVEEELTAARTKAEEELAAVKAKA